MYRFSKKRDKIIKRINDERIRQNAIKVYTYQPKLRENITKAERVLRACLQRNQCLFSFQRPLYGKEYAFIVDFYIKITNTKGIIVEVDGSSHIGRENYDAWRDFILENKRKYKVLHYSNNEVLEDSQKIVDYLISCGAKRWQYKHQKEKTPPN